MLNRQRFVFWRLDVVNGQKTRLLGLGIWKERKQWPSELLTSSPNIKVLGIVYCPTVKETKAINLSQLQTKVRRSLWQLKIGDLQFCKGHSTLKSSLCINSSTWQWFSLCQRKS